MILRLRLAYTTRSSMRFPLLSPTKVSTSKTQRNVVNTACKNKMRQLGFSPLVNGRKQQRDEILLLNTVQYTTTIQFFKANLEIAQKLSWIQIEQNNLQTFLTGESQKQGKQKMFFAKIGVYIFAIFGHPPRTTYVDAENLWLKY